MIWPHLWKTDQLDNMQRITESAIAEAKKAAAELNVTKNKLVDQANGSLVKLKNGKTK